MKPETKNLGFRNIYLQPAFLVCVAVLAIAGSSMSLAIKSFGVYLKKEPLPLKKSLELLDENALGSYKVLKKSKIENNEIIEELGTEDYIKWILEDIDETDDSSVRRCLLFITYYDLPDRVPHVPEECYVGGGHQKLTSDSVILKVNMADNQRRTYTQDIPVKYLLFSATKSNYLQGDRKFPVMYLFNVNGSYSNSREDARIALNKNIFGKHSYFCKVEWNFFNLEFGTELYPSKEEAVAASQKLLNVILPVLEKQHWPELDNTVSDAKQK